MVLWKGMRSRWKKRMRRWDDRCDLGWMLLYFLMIPYTSFQDHDFRHPDHVAGGIFMNANQILEISSLDGFLAMFATLPILVHKLVGLFEGKYIGVSQPRLKHQNCVKLSVIGSELKPPLPLPPSLP